MKLERADSGRPRLAALAADELRSSALAGVVASAATVTVATGLIAPLHHVMPVRSLVGVYVVAALAVAVIWGLPYGVAVSLASMLAFNFFYLPPVHSLALADSRDWAVLGASLVIAVIASGLGTRPWAGLAGARAAGARVGPWTRRTEIEAPSEGGRAPLALRGEEARARRRLVSALASLLRVPVTPAGGRPAPQSTAVLRAVSGSLGPRLADISGSADALVRADAAYDDDDRAELLVTILDATDQLDQLADDLFDLSRLEAPTLGSSSQLVEPDDLVALALLELGVGGRVLETRATTGLPPVRVDPRQVAHGLVKVIENALEYSPGSEPVRITVDGGEGCAIVRVSDRGPGVPAGERERIFEPFQRGAAALGRSGAGLGLTIARGFIEASGGELRLEPRSEPGASFAVTFPTAEVGELPCPELALGDDHLLARPRPRDAPVFGRFALDPDAARVLGWSDHQPGPAADSRWAEVILGYLRGWEERSRLALVVRRRASGSAVGLVELRLSGASADVSIVISPEARGRGIATQALATFLDWGERELGLSQARLACARTNLAASRVAEKCGFALVGRDRDALRFALDLGDAADPETAG